MQARRPRGVRGGRRRPAPQDRHVGRRMCAPQKLCSRGSEPALDAHPIVDSEYALKWLATKRSTSDDFPTPASPSSTSFTSRTFPEGAAMMAMQARGELEPKGALLLRHQRTTSPALSPVPMAAAHVLIKPTSNRARNVPWAATAPRLQPRWHATLLAQRVRSSIRSAC